MNQTFDKDESRRETKFVQKTFRMGSAPERVQEKALAAADAMEDEGILRKLENDRSTRI